MKKIITNQINLDLLIRTIQDNYDKHPLRALDGAIQDNNKYYKYIPSYVHELKIVIEDLIDENINLIDKNFIDIGCGLPVVPDLFKILGCKETIGLECSPLYTKVFGNNRIINEDLLTHNFKDYDILYSYNPIIDCELMEKGLENIISTMKKNAIFYFNKASQVNVEKLNLIKVHSNIYKYIKQ